MAAASSAATAARRTARSAATLASSPARRERRGLLEPALGVGELLPRLRLAGARVALGPLGLLDLGRDRLERAAHPAGPRPDVVDPAQQADDIVDPRRDVEVAPFELAHVRDEVGGAIVGHAPSIADDEGRYGCLVSRTVDTAPVDGSDPSALQLTADEMRDVGELIRAIPVLGDRLRVIARSRLHRP